MNESFFLLLLANAVLSSPLSIRVPPTADLQKRLDAARELLSETILISSHGSFLTEEESPFSMANLREAWPENVTLPPVDRRGISDLQMWSAEIPCDAQYNAGVQFLLESVDLIKRILATQANETSLVTTSVELKERFQRGQHSSLLGIKGGHSLGSSMGVIRAMHELGVRYITLTHECHTPWAESWKGDIYQLNSLGITGFGKAIVIELNRLGVIIDLSYSSGNTARDVLNISAAPVIFSNSAVRHLCPGLQGVPDDILSSLAENDGLYMISFTQVSSCMPNATIVDVIRHINHARTMAGVDHVGLGGGHNEIQNFAAHVAVSVYDELFAELLGDPSWSLSDLRKLAGNNFLRVFDKIEQVKEELQLESPSEDLIPIHDIDSKWPCRYKFANLPEAAERS